MMLLFSSKNLVRSFPIKNQRVKYILWLISINHKLISRAQPIARSNRRISLASLAFGPQHPAAHGILRMALQLRGEVVVQLDPCFGYLHRGSEKLIETRTYLQALPYFDRFDYVANLFQEHAFCRAIESLIPNNKLITQVNNCRMLLDELSRILNHLLTLAATSLDLGVMGPIFWAFEEREYIFELFEHLSGARMHTAIYKPFYLDFSAFSNRFFDDLIRLVTRCARSLAASVLGLLSNRTLKSRLSNIGQISLNRSISYGLTGLPARSSGLLTDLRRTNVSDYATAYTLVGLKSFVGSRGDNYDRFILRIREVSESLRVITILASTLIDSVQLPNEIPQSRTFTSMEAVIKHFQDTSIGFVPNSGWSYASVESPKGELGVSLLADNSISPIRSKLRTPVSHNMHVIPSINHGCLISDFVATFCSLDIVLGEIDR